MQLADIAMSKRDTRKALDQLEDLSDEQLSAPEEVFLRLGRTAEADGDREKALKAYRRVYYDFPLSEQAIDAQSGIERLETPSLVSPDRFKQELARAERLFGARRWAQARAAFVPLARAAAGDDRTLVALRWRNVTTISIAIARRATRCGRTSTAGRAKPKRGSFT